MATIEERITALETQLAALTAPPTDYYILAETGETVDAAVQAVKSGNFVIPSSTSDSTKKFKLTVDDSGTVSATEVTS
nr:MAG TPA: zipper dimerization domain transcription factor-like protein [Caudoviricetes sp.]